MEHSVARLTAEFDRRGGDPEAEAALARSVPIALVEPDHPVRRWRSWIGRIDDRDEVVGDPPGAGGEVVEAIDERLAALLLEPIGPVRLARDRSGHALESVSDVLERPDEARPRRDRSVEGTGQGDDPERVTVERITPAGGVEEAGGRARHSLAVEQVVERAEHVAQPVVALDVAGRAARGRRPDPVARLSVGFFHQGPIEAGRQRVGHRSLERVGLVDDEQRPIRRREVVEMGEQEGVVRDEQAVPVEDLADRARVLGRR